MRILCYFVLLVAYVILNRSSVAWGSPGSKIAGGWTTMGSVNQTDVNNTFGSQTNSVNGSLRTVDFNDTDAPYGNDSTTVFPQRTDLPWRVTYQTISFYIKGFYFPITTVLAVLGNTLSISILRRDVLHSNSTVYLLALAVADMLFGIVFFPTIFRNYSLVANHSSFKTFYAFYVSYVFPLVNVLHTTAVWVTVCFTSERFVAVSFPMVAQKYTSKLRSQVAVVSTFLFGLAFNGYRFFRRTVVLTKDHVTEETYYTYTLTELGRSEGGETAFFWAYFLVTKGIPFPILIVLNSFVVWNVWQARKKRYRLTSKSGFQDDKNSSRENQITRMLISIVIAFLLCNALAGGASLFVAMNGMHSVYTNTKAWVSYMFTVGEALINTNPLVNCVLYTACSQTMRSEMVRMLCPKRLSIAKQSLKSPVVTEQVDLPTASDRIKKNLLKSIMFKKQLSMGHSCLCCQRKI